MNGYFDLKNGEFKEREEYCRITDCINRNYKKPKKRSMEKVKELLSMIYPNKDDKNYLMMTIATALCGIATMDQSILFLLGKGSSGKSTVMKMLKNSIGMYFVELKSDTFVMGNQKADKKMDDSLFKSVCEGTAQTTRLFQDGVTEIQMNALIMI